ncbi:MAG: hypothetical protein WA021_03900 [Minisyncoccia bacterium]
MVFSETARAARIATLVALLSSICLLPLSIIAQTTTNGGVEANASAPAEMQGTTSCFEYYHFNSVQANLTAPVASTVSGATISFSGTLTNANSYPVVDGTLYVKVFRIRGIDKDPLGPDVIDQFPVQDGIVIPANGSVPVSFEWRVPAYALSGEYQLATFFVTAQKSNLLGLSFTDDVVGNMVTFDVLGEQEASVAFLKSNTMVDGQPYYFAAYPPVLGTDPVVVTGSVRNTGATTERATVRWKVYQWDAQAEEQVIQEETATVSVPAGGSLPVSITVRDQRYPVYLAVGEVSWRDTKSLINVRFARDGVDRLKLNFPAITAYPLTPGEEATLFSCLHNSGSASVIENGRLELTLTDTRGRTIHSHTYTGDVTGRMMAVASPFTPSRAYNSFVLGARLFQDGQLVDEVSVAYNCDQLAPGQCEEEGYPWWYIPGALALVLVLGLIALSMRRREPLAAPPQPSSL